MKDSFVPFAQTLLSRLRALRPEAEPLEARQARGGADIGIDEDGDFEPVLRVANASKAVNVMSLWVRMHEAWQPTFIRGTPAEIAQKLAGPYEYLWRIAVIAMGFDTPPPSPRPRARHSARRKTKSR